MNLAGLSACLRLCSGFTSIRRFASRHLPASASFTRRDDFRNRRFMKITAEMVAGINKKKNNRAETTLSLLDSLRSDESGKLIQKDSVTITKLPQVSNSRMKHLGSIFLKHIVSVFQTLEVSSRMSELGFQINGVVAGPNFSYIAVSWQTFDPEKGASISELLPRLSSELSDALAELRVVGNVPPVLFYKDDCQLKILEVEQLLSIADMGPEEDQMVEDASQDDDFDDRVDFVKNADEQRPSVASRSSVKKSPKDYPVEIPRDVYGIDHDAMKAQLLNVKNKVQNKLHVESAVDNKIIEIDIERP